MLLVIEIKIENEQIRMLTGYGPQETVSLEDKMEFYMKVEEEIVKGNNAGKEIIFMGDLNAKLGKEIIKKDPNKQSENGKILAGVVERNALTVVNSLEEKCVGTITRERCTVGGVEKSVIDYVIVSKGLTEKVEKMEIDEERRNTLAKIMKTKQGVKVTESDHNTIITQMKMNTEKRIKN